jgi:hypothetical protein
MGRTGKSLTTAAAAAIALPLALAAPAAAQGSSSAVSVTGGQTMLQLDRGTAAALRRAHVSVSLVRPARVGASGLTFPVTGGSVNPASLAGSVSHRGGITFRAGGKRLTLRNFTYRIGGRSTLSAQVGSSRVTILSLNTSRARVTRAGLNTRASGVRVSLTQAAATALNRTFGVRTFRRGLRLGTVRTELRYGQIAFRGGETRLALDPGAGQALASLGISAAPIDPASAKAGGLAFPITGGKVNARTLAGEITHSGGLALTRDATRVELRDFTIGIDGSPALSALVGGQRVEILSLDVSDITTRVNGRNVTVSGVVARLTAAAAQALNDAFGTTAFAEGLTLGTAQVRGQAR